MKRRRAQEYEGTAKGAEAANDLLCGHLAEPAARFGLSPVQLAQALAEISQLIGMLVLELGGHFAGTADPADHLWDHVVTAQG